MDSKTVEIPIQIPKDISIEIPKDIPMGIPIQSPMQSPMDIPIQIPNDIPMGMPMQIPMDIPLDIPVDIPIDIPMDIPLDIPMGIPMDDDNWLNVNQVPSTVNPPNDVPDGSVIESGCRKYGHHRDTVINLNEENTSSHSAESGLSAMNEKSMRYSPYWSSWMN